MRRSAGSLALLAAVLFGVAGCAGPKIVRSVTSSRDQIKFLYVQDGEQGVVQCKVAGDGALQQCHSMQVILEE